MGRHKVAELEGARLDKAVALAEYVLIESYNQLPADYAPSRNWHQGGPIIERERITVSYGDQGGRERGMWNAYVHDCDVMCQDFNSALVAAMRAYCASKFGDEVELP
jgi:hypothetical protein